MTPVPTAGSDRLVHISSGSTSLLLEAPDGALPSVVHWGAALGELDEGLAATAAVANLAVVGPNTADESVRLTLPIENRTAYTGRPGLAGSRAGRNWSSAFSTTSVTWND